MTLDWETMPPATIGRPPVAHPFARDLDLTGERSLHRTVIMAQSADGKLGGIIEIGPDQERATISSGPLAES